MSDEGANNLTRLAVVIPALDEESTLPATLARLRLEPSSMAQMNRRQLEVRRQQVLASLSAPDAGTYGLCRSCKGPVALARLEVLPEVPFCVGCQERFERER